MDDEIRCIIFEQPVNGAADGDRRGWVVERPVIDQSVWEVRSLDGGVTCYFPSKALGIEYAEFKAGLRSVPNVRRDAALTESSIQEKLAQTNYGQVLAERGITTVALNQEGEIVEYPPPPRSG